MAAEDEPRGITVRGVGRVAVPPDQATLSLGVEGRAKTAGQAQAAASTAMTGLIAALDDLGIGPRDRATTAIDARGHLHLPRRWQARAPERVPGAPDPGGHGA